MLNFQNVMNGTMVQGGGMYTQQAPVQTKMPTMQNLLTPQEMAELKQDVFNITIKESDLVRNKCTHKRNNGFAMVPDPTRDGYMKCTICGKSFKICDEPLESVIEKTQEVINMIETVKVIGVELPEKFLQEIAKMETVLELLPQVHNVTLKTWVDKYEQATNTPYQSMGAGANQMFNYLMGGNGGAYNPYGNGYYQQFQQPQMQYNGYGYQQQPMGMQQPYGGYQQQPMGMQQPYGGYQQQPQMQQQQMNMQYTNTTQAQPNPFTVGGMTTPGYSQPPQQNVQQQAAPQQQQAPQQPQQPAGQPAPTYQPPTGGGGDKPVATKSMKA